MHTQLHATKRMIAVYCTERGHLEQVCGALLDAHLAAESDWPAFERLAAAARCSVVVVPWLNGDGQLGRLADLRRRLPLQPLVVITAKDADNVRLLGGLLIEEVLWLDEIPRRLAAAVASASQTDRLTRMADALGTAPHLPVLLRRALHHALVADPPLHTVAALAAAVGRDRRSLWRYWHEAFHDEPPLRLQDLLDWLLLLRAATLKTPGRNWAGVAAELQIHEHTISRLAGRLAGLSLRELAAGGQGPVADLFAARVYAPIMAPVPIPATA
jgi:hypothetical protein